MWARTGFVKKFERSGRPFRIPFNSWTLAFYSFARYCSSVIGHVVDHEKIFLAVFTGEPAGVDPVKVGHDGDKGRLAAMRASDHRAFSQQRTKGNQSEVPPFTVPIRMRVSG
jgi:hypothetical protein